MNAECALKIVKRRLSMRIKFKMANISLKLQNKQFYFRVPESPAQIELISVKNKNSINSHLSTSKKKKNSQNFFLRRMSQIKKNKLNILSLDI
jgi:hypothetical protein